jgi:hypothetical protein
MPCHDGWLRSSRRVAVQRWTISSFSHGGVFIKRSFWVVRERSESREINLCVLEKLADRPAETPAPPLRATG